MQDESTVSGIGYIVSGIELGKEKIQRKLQCARCKMRAKKNTKTVCRSEKIQIHGITEGEIGMTKTRRVG